MHADRLNSPLFALIACAAASVAAFTAATSPTTTAVSSALPTCVIGPANSTLAASQHRVRPLHEGNQPARFDKSNCLMSHSLFLSLI